MPKSAGIRRCRCARGVVTSHAVTAWIDWPVRGALVGWCVGSVACRDARISKRGLTLREECGTRVADFRAWCRDKGRVLPSLMLNGGGAENTQTLGKEKSRERPSLMLSGGRAENTRSLCKEKGRERPSLMLSGGRAENTRTLCKDKGRERPSLMLSGDRVENARALDGSGGREHPEPSADGFGGKELRMPVLFYGFRRERIRIAVAENTRASSWSDQIWF